MRASTRTTARATALLAFVAAATATGRARAQSTPSTTAIDTQNYWPMAGPQQAVALRSSDVQPSLSFGFALLANYMHRPLVFVEQGTGATQNAIQYAITTDFVFGFGLFDRLQLSVAIPFVASQSGVGAAPLTGGGIGAQLPSTAFRDVRFDIGVGIVQRAHRSDADGFGLRLDVGLTAPVGDAANFQAASSTTFTPMIVADYRVVGLTVTLNAGARVREAAAVANIAWASQAPLGGGLAYRPAGFDRFMLGVDVLALVPLYGQLTVATQQGTARVVTTYQPIVPVELFYGARYAVDPARDLEFTLGGGVPLTSDATVPEFRVIAGAAYSPRGYDTDRDGVPDAVDHCIRQPEDRDGFQDSDGCPDPDNDNDRVPDVNDRCPNAPEDYDNFEDTDGCPDPDNDRDGVPDVTDECANEPAGAHPDPEHPGCPIRDRDGDGVLDADDRCPEQPVGDHPDPARAGCPLPDRDHDGVADDVDQCPSDPAGAHPDPARAGCPDPDLDHDGVLNEIDRCPDQPETINGVTDDDGCPDAGDATVSFAGNAVIFANAVHLRAGARALSVAERASIAQAAQLIRGRERAVTGIDVAVVPGSGAAAALDAERLAGLVADALAQGQIERATIHPSAAAPERARAARGELRIRVVTAPRSAPAATVPPVAPPTP